MLENLEKELLQFFVSSLNIFHFAVFLVLFILCFIFFNCVLGI
jgi:hypothetical protein